MFGQDAGMFMLLLAAPIILLLLTRKHIAEEKVIVGLFLMMGEHLLASSKLYG
jgi:hypothetical protein